MLRAVLILVASGALSTAVIGVLLAQRGVFGGSGPEPSASPVALDLETPTPQGEPVRLVFIGTSLTHGEIWPGAVAAALSACRPGGVVAEIVALPGAASPWGVDALDKALAMRPHVVAIEYAINDASLWRGVTLARSRANHEEMIRRIRAAGATPVLATMNHAFGREAWERPGLAAYEALYRALAVELSVGLVDIAPRWRALDADALTRRMPDGLHPTPEATIEIVVPAFVAALGPAVCS